METTKLVIAVPAYNEEAMLPITIPAMLSVLESMINKGKISDRSRLLFVNDGSKDNTWQEILDAQKADNHVTGVSFSKNSGHQNALIAGLEVTKDADAIVTIDADLQDDINAIEEMVDKFNEGYEVVYGVEITETLIHLSNDQQPWRFIRLCQSWVQRQFLITLIFDC